MSYQQIDIDLHNKLDTQSRELDKQMMSQISQHFFYKIVVPMYDDINTSMEIITMAYNLNVTNIIN